MRHFNLFLALGLFWGISPSFYKHLSNIGMPVSHTICLTGLGVGVLMWAIAGYRGVAEFRWRSTAMVRFVPS